MLGGSLRGWVAEVEASWLGFSSPPVERLWEQVGWRPEPLGEACRRCGVTLVDEHCDGGGCSSCRHRSLPYSSVLRLGKYEPPLDAWIKSVKYRAWSEMGNRLGRLLGKRLMDSGALGEHPAAVVAMPMPPVRRLHRGIDHAGVISGGVADATGLRCWPLLRQAAGRPQVVRARTDRRRRNSGRFSPARRVVGLGRLRGVRMVLVDDVLTTGASLAGAARLLERLEVESVIVGVVAVVDPPGRRRIQPDPGFADPSP